MGSNDVVVMDRVDVKAVGSNDAMFLESDAVVGTACSLSIRGAGGSRALNSGCRGFFKASRRF
uniref:Uncharacterized protein n=1 Tax=Romanomermis culicivorax TaxID=13658 RepID=A0A915IG88_ROMCU